ncbi:hypothetical protein [Actinoplanes sp. NPDC049118]|uniref:hypothetical protein n=1 Tax=Actinoplanes sp. NPDC049118 TaxID=3155769 RepID=UPI0033E840F6
MTNVPWAAVLVICTPMAAITIMFLWAIWMVEKSRRVEAIKAMAELVKALRPGRRNRLP